MFFSLEEAITQEYEAKEIILFDYLTCSIGKKIFNYKSLNCPKLEYRLTQIYKKSEFKNKKSGSSLINYFNSNSFIFYNG